MKNLFCCFYLRILIFKRVFCATYDCNVVDDNTKIVLDLKEACEELSSYENKTVYDFEIIEYDDFLPVNSADKNNEVFDEEIIEYDHSTLPVYSADENNEVLDEEKADEIIKKPNEHLKKYLDDLKKLSSDISEPLGGSDLLNFADKTIDLINLFQDASENNSDDNTITLKDSFHSVDSKFKKLDKLSKEVELIYEEMKTNRPNRKTNFKYDFIFIKGIIYGLKNEFERCLVSYKNICEIDLTKKIELLHEHQSNMREIRQSLSPMIRTNVEIQVGNYKTSFFETVSLVYKSLSEIFETEDRFFERYFKTLDSLLMDVKKCFEKLESLKNALIKN